MDDPTKTFPAPETEEANGTAAASENTDEAVPAGEYRYVPVAEPRQNITAQEWMTQVSSDGSVRFYNKDSGRYICVYKGMLVEKEPGVDGNRHFTIMADYTTKTAAAQVIEGIGLRQGQLMPGLKRFQAYMLAKDQY
jgi:hypothetical protein